MRGLTRWRRAIVLAVIGASLLSGCASDGAHPSADASATGLPPGDRGSVGQVEGTSAFVAIVASGGRAVAYVCDGEPDGIASTSDWFAGAVSSDGSIDLASSHGARLHAAPVPDGGYRGTFEPGDGRHLAFTTTRTTTDRAGIYRIGTGGDGEAGVVGGWVVDNTGDVRGALAISGTVSKVPALPGGSLLVGGQTVTVVVFMTPPENPATPPGVPIPYPNTIR